MSPTPLPHQLRVLTPRNRMFTGEVNKNIFPQTFFKCNFYFKFYIRQFSPSLKYFVISGSIGIFDGNSANICFNFFVIIYQ